MPTTCTSRNIRIATLVAAMLLICASGAGAISRNDVLSRAQLRVDKPVPYSQSRYYAGYRTDCSGYVSMCWQTGISYSTRSLPNITYRIPAADLKPGDALNKRGYHVRLFYGWLDESKTNYVAYESAGSKIAGVRIHSLAEDLSAGYVPVRYKRISYSPGSDNVLKNGRFDTWTRPWGASADRPVWWDVGAAWREQLVTRRQDDYRTSRNSAKLTNPGSTPEMPRQISQTVRVVPGVDYRLTAYAKSATDPSAIELRLTYLNAQDVPVAEMSLTGDQAGVNASSFSKMSLLLATPTETARARVTITLAPRSTPTTFGSVPATTTVLLDDISLARPRLSVSIRRSTWSARTGTRVTLSGSVTPTAAVDATATVYVRKPGGSWTRLAATAIRPAETTGVWSTSYRFTSSMRRGTYLFRTSVPAVPGYLGTTSGSVSVTLR